MTGGAGGAGTGDCCGGGTVWVGRVTGGSAGAVTTVVGADGCTGADMETGFSGARLDDGVTELITPCGVTGACVSYRQAMVSASTIRGMPISSDIVSITRPAGWAAVGSPSASSTAANCSVGVSGTESRACVGALFRSVVADVS